MSTGPVTVRDARPGDIPALVRLRISNAETHVGLGPGIHRVPGAGAVRRYFEDVLAGRSGVRVVVAETGGAVVGMSEIVPVADPPDHQILIPRRAAEIHTVTLPAHRGRGVGAELVRAAEQAAAASGVEVIYAAIFAPNHGAARFYEAAGYGPRGTLLRKELRGNDGPG